MYSCDMISRNLTDPQKETLLVVISDRKIGTRFACPDFKGRLPDLYSICVFL